MQTVNFQCGHCGNLMAVSSEFLGQQVRCPHCQQVVVAPAAPTPPAPALAPDPATTPAPPSSGFGVVETVMGPPPVADPEDIFAPEDASDDLFGRSNAPRIEIPPEPFSATLPADAAARPPEPVLDPTLAVTVPSEEVAAPPAGNGEATVTLPPAGPEPSWMASTLPDTSADAAPQPLAPAAMPATARAGRRERQGIPWFMLLVVSPLVLYSIVITVFAARLYLYLQEIQQNQRNPFEKLPDAGDHPGVKKQEQTTSWIDTYSPEFATQPLPAHLRTKLRDHHPLQIGQLKVTPLRVEKARVRFFTEYSTQVQACMADSLVLYLEMENVSTDQVFAPLDNYFDRAWKPGQDMVPPLTYLQAGPNNFYGGPADWYPRGMKGKRRDWIEGRKAFDPQVLEPGKKKRFFVCTNGSDPKAVRTLFGEGEDGAKVGKPYQGSLLWRIRVRRGLAEVNGKEYSTTAVIGVEFSDKDIEPGKWPPPPEEG